MAPRKRIAERFLQAHHLETSVPRIHTAVMGLGQCTYVKFYHFADLGRTVTSGVDSAWIKPCNVSCTEASAMLNFDPRNFNLLCSEVEGWRLAGMLGGVAFRSGASASGQGLPRCPSAYRSCPSVICRNVP